jgi:hypothetical protein
MEFRCIHFYAICIVYTRSIHENSPQAGSDVAGRREGIVLAGDRCNNARRAPANRLGWAV